MLNPVPIFQQIVQTGQSGRVDFESGVTKHQFYVAGGVLRYVTSTDPYFSLDAYLVRKQSLTKSDQKQIRSRAQNPPRPIESLIANMGLLSQEELSGAIASLGREILFELFSWPEGDSSFSLGENPPQFSLQVDLDLGSLLEKGQQVSEKWQILLGKVPKLEAVLGRPAQTQSTDIEISPEEWQILAAVDDIRNVHEVCSELSPNRLQLLSRIARLLEKNLLHISDFRERVLSGSLSGRNLKFSTIATVFRNLFSIFLERSGLNGNNEGIQLLHLTMKTLADKGYPPIPGLGFDSKTVFQPQQLLESFAYSGQAGDLKSLTKGLAWILQESLSQLREINPASLSEIVADMKSVLTLAEGVLPDFQMTAQATAEKALQATPLPAMPQPPKPVAPLKPAPTTELNAIPAAIAFDQQTQEIPALSFAQTEAQTVVVSQQSITPPSTAPYLAPPAAPASYTPTREASPRHSETQSKPLSVESRPIKTNVPTQTLTAVSSLPAQAKKSEQEASVSKSVSPPKKVKIVEEEEAVDFEPEETTDEEHSSSRNTLLWILLVLILFLFTALGVGGYFIWKDPKLRNKIRQTVKKLELVQHQENSSDRIA